MRIFICEFITGGGLQDKDLPATLVTEGDMMLQALVCDLLDAGYDDLFCTRDIRLQETAPDIETINAGENIWETWKNCMSNTDAVWIIAPETDMVLYDLTCISEQCGCLLLGCSSTAVALATSKKQTIELLTANGIPCVPVINDYTELSNMSSGHIIKPDDGVGAEGCYLFTEQDLLYSYISQQKQKKYIVQEYIRGIPASMSMVCHGGQALVLGYNRQLVTFINGKGQLKGVVVNGLYEFAEQFSAIAKQVSSAVSGLSGYVGVDLILAENGPLVLEINPRLTTAYAGLSRSNNSNTAEIIMSVMQNKQFPAVNKYDHRPVTIDLC